MFKHNDAKALEGHLRAAISDGQPRTHRPWRKIMVVVEGIYSMEGEICDLKPIVAVAKKYKVSCCVYASAGGGDRRLLTVMTRLVTRSTLLLLRDHSLR